MLSSGLLGDGQYTRLIIPSDSSTSLFVVFASCTLNFGSDDLNLHLFIMLTMICFPDTVPMALRTSSWFIPEKKVTLKVAKVSF